MRFDGNGGRGPNYEPNSHGGPAQTSAATDLGYDVAGSVGPRGLVKHAEDDDFAQAGALYRVMKEDEQQRLIGNLDGGLAQVTRPEVIERSISYFAKADPDYGRRLAAAVARLRK